MLKVELKATQFTRAHRPIPEQSLRPFLPCFRPKPVPMDRLSDFDFGETTMSGKTIISAAALALITVSLAGCGNTIRGIGRDMGNAVDATQDAGRSVANSVR